MQLDKGLIFVRPTVVGIYLKYIAQQLMKKIFSIVSKLSAKRFTGLHSDWSKLLLGSHAFVRGHRNLRCILHHTPKVGQLDEGHCLKMVWLKFTKLGIKVQ